MIISDRTREGHRQSDKRWNRFKRQRGENFRETGVQHMQNYGLSQGAIFGCTELKHQQHNKTAELKADKCSSST